MIGRVKDIKRHSNLFSWLYLDADDTRYIWVGRDSSVEHLQGLFGVNQLDQINPHMVLKWIPLIDSLTLIQSFCLAAIASLRQRHVPTIPYAFG